MIRPRVVAVCEVLLLGAFVWRDCKILALAGTRDALASGPLFLLSVCSSSGCVRCCCCFFSLLRVLVWVCFLLRAGRSWGMAGIGGRVQVLLVPL